MLKIECFNLESVSATCPDTIDLSGLVQLKHLERLEFKYLYKVKELRFPHFDQDIALQKIRFDDCCNLEVVDLMPLAFLGNKLTVEMRNNMDERILNHANKFKY